MKKIIIVIMLLGIVILAAGCSKTEYKTHTGYHNGGEIIITETKIEEIKIEENFIQEIVIH